MSCRWSTPRPTVVTSPSPIAVQELFDVGIQREAMDAAVRHLCATVLKGRWCVSTACRRLSCSPQGPPRRPQSRLLRFRRPSTLAPKDFAFGKHVPRPRPELLLMGLPWPPMPHLWLLVDPSLLRIPRLVPPRLPLTAAVLLPWCGLQFSQVIP